MIGLRIVLAVLAAFFLGGTLLSLTRSSAWWIRMFDFPRVQIAIAGLGLGLAYVGLGLVGADLWSVEWGLAWALVALAAFQALRMRPYTPLHSVQTIRADPDAPDPDRRLRLMVSNVLMENREGERWLSVVREADPDVLVAVETDAWWAATARELEATHPHTVEQPQDDTYGMVVRSRLPLADVEVRHLVEETVPSLFLTATLPSGDAVSLVFLHPRPPRPDIGQDSAFRDAELVLAGREVAERDGPIVVAGDLNDVAWSRTTSLFQRISGLLDPRIGRGTFSTFHAGHWWLRYPLDHVFHSDHFALVSLRRLPHVGSDHFPILIELELEPVAEAVQEGPGADAEDRADAEEAVEEAEQVRDEESPEERRERQEADQ